MKEFTINPYLTLRHENNQTLTKKDNNHDS